MSEKYDVFVGNLTFNTTEEQLRELFQFIGPVKNIRILTDKETGKPKGFAFVEYFDTNSALSAIKHLDQAEMNGRKIKVGYPSQSNLKDIARQIGHVLPDQEGGGGVVGGMGGPPAGFSFALYQQRQQQEQNIVNSLKLHEAWDILDAMKSLVLDDSKAEKLQALLENYPQIISAIYEIEKRLGIALPAHIQQQLANPFSSSSANTSNNPLPQEAQQPSRGMKNALAMNPMNLYGGDYYGPQGMMMMEEDPSLAMNMNNMNHMNNMNMNQNYYYEGAGGGDMAMMPPMDVYGPPAGAGGLPGRVSRFGAPDHANLSLSNSNNMMMNPNPRGEVYYDQYGNEFFMPDYANQNQYE